MLDRPPTDADEDSRRLRRSFLIAVFFTAALWAIKLAELALGMDISLGVVRWERRAIALALAVFLLYGGMI